MPDFPLPQANTSIVQSFANLNGTSAPFSLPYGFYWLQFRVADTNVNTIVTVNDLANPGNGRDAQGYRYGCGYAPMAVIELGAKVVDVGAGDWILRYEPGWAIVMIN